MRKIKLPSTEKLSLLLSVAAVLISVLSIVDSRQAGLEAKRSQLRSEITEVHLYGQGIWRRARCSVTIRGDKQMSDQMKWYSESGADLLDEGLAKNRIHEMSEEEIRSVQSEYALLRRNFRRINDAVDQHVMRLTQPELETYKARCEAGG